MNGWREQPHRCLQAGNDVRRRRRRGPEPTSRARVSPRQSFYTSHTGQRCRFQKKKTATAPLPWHTTHRAPRHPHGRGPSSTRVTGSPVNPHDSRLPGPPPRRPGSTPPGDEERSEERAQPPDRSTSKPHGYRQHHTWAEERRARRGPGTLSRPQIEAARRPHNPSVPGREPPRAPPSRRSPPAMAAMAVRGDQPLQRSRSAPSNMGG